MTICADSLLPGMDPNGKWLISHKSVRRPNLGDICLFILDSNERENISSLLLKSRRVETSSHC